MNLLAHILLSYNIATYFTSDSNLIVMAVFLGILPDFDHIPHLAGALKTLRFGSKSRSRFHELYGLSFISLGVAIISFFKPSLFPLLFFPVLSHYLLDFLSRETRPFFPTDDFEVFLGWFPQKLKTRTLADIIVTGGLLLWAF